MPDRPSIMDNPTPQDPNVPVMSPSSDAPATASVQNAPATPPKDQTVNLAPVAAAAHQGVIGNLVKGLLGNNTSYQVDPQSGKMVETETPRKPGDLFRHIVAGAILGGAAGSGQPNFSTGITRGGAAAIQDQRNQEEIKKKQAAEQFQRNREVSADAREQSRLDSENKLRDAQIAFHNVQTIHENKLIQGMDLEQHQKMAEIGKTQIQPYLDAGLQAVYKDMPESQMNDLIKNNPNAMKYLWEPTGTRLFTGPDGKPTYETTYSAVDPQGKIPVTQGLVDLMKSAGMDKYYPDLFKVLKPGAEIDANQMMAIQHQYQTLTNQNFERDKNKATLDEIKARTQLARAGAARDYAEAGKYADDKKQAGLMSEALKDYNKVGGDWTKLQPGSKIVLAESASKMAANSINAFKAAEANADEAGKQKALQDYEFFNGLARQAFDNAPKPATTPAAAAPTTPEGQAAADFNKTQNEATAAQAKREADRRAEFEGRPADPEFIGGAGKIEKQKNPNFTPAEQYIKEHPNLTPSQRASVRAQYKQRQSGGSAVPAGSTPVAKDAQNKPVYQVNGQYVYQDGSPYTPPK